MTKEELDALASKVIGCAIEVHKELGPGLLESVYHKCLKVALEEEGLDVESELSLPVYFRGRKITDEGYRLDLLVEDTIILELKSVSQMQDVFTKQLGTYLRLADKPLGFLINFNEVLLKNGIKRVINGYY
ncbi:MAG: GxxExxY protein [Bacteroidales bacterium]|jgi:GxxExxY protein|nr:GxxExxY protein [Bacteroidales bacterium]MBR4273673.1 GxxExxY protein [Bacteroidales bacterium]